jgi:hypothetical protein
MRQAVRLLQAITLAAHFTRGTDEADPMTGSPSTSQRHLWATPSAPNATPRVLKHSEAGPYYPALETDAYSCIVLEASARLVVPSGPIVPGAIDDRPAWFVSNFILGSG